MKPILIKQIEQKNNQVFCIVWSDNVQQDFRLSHLQKQCPCANCVDENTGKRIVDSSKIREDLKAISIRTIGRYALQIHFSSGCSTGIYTFDMLRNMEK